MESEGARFKKARKSLGFTLQLLSELTDFSVSTISGVENGQDRPSKRLRALLIEKLDINEPWLRTGKGQMFNEENALMFDLKLSLDEKLRYSPIEHEIRNNPDMVAFINHLRYMPSVRRRQWLKVINQILEKLAASDQKVRDAAERRRRLKPGD